MSDELRNKNDEVRDELLDGWSDLLRETLKSLDGDSELQRRTYVAAVLTIASEMIVACNVDIEKILQGIRVGVGHVRALPSEAWIDP